MKRTTIYVKSKGGFHIVKIGRGRWVFDTLHDALEWLYERYRYEPK